MAFPLAALTDEISPDLDSALATMASTGITRVELRTVYGKNVLELTDDEAQSALASVHKAGMTVSGIASPVGKSPLDRPAAEEEARLDRALQLSALLQTACVRVFSFYPPEGRELDALANEVFRRLAAWSRRAEAASVTLLLENEVGLWADVPTRCRRALEAVSSPYLRFAWDPANFLRSAVSHPFDTGWSLLHEWVACVHVKDCRREGDHTVAGQGDGQWPQLVAALAAKGGVPLVMEPHLQVAGHSVGFTGPERFLEAVAAVRALLP